jgi:hypothetical protein
MRFFSHDPWAEARKGILYLVVGGLVLSAVVAGIVQGGRGVSPRIAGTGLAGGVFALALVFMGAMTLREAAVLRREKGLRVRKPLRSRVRWAARDVEPGMTVDVDLRPDLVPPFPIRRMIGVTVLFAGLIGPLVLGALYLASLGPVAAGCGLVPLLAAGGLGHLLRRLWKGKVGAVRVSMVLFLFGLVPSAVALAGLLLSGAWSEAGLAAASTSYFACGYAAVLSLRGRWLQQQEWTSGRGPLAAVDKAAVLKALRETGVRPRKA